MGLSERSFSFTYIHLFSLLKKRSGSGSKKRNGSKSHYLKSNGRQYHFLKKFPNYYFKRRFEVVFRFFLRKSQLKIAFSAENTTWSHVFSSKHELKLRFHQKIRFKVVLLLTNTKLRFKVIVETIFFKNDNKDLFMLNSDIWTNTQNMRPNCVLLLKLRESNFLLIKMI